MSLTGNEETIQFTYDVEVDSDLWAKFLGLCEQTGSEPLGELTSCIEEYIASIKSESEI